MAADDILKDFSLFEVRKDRVQVQHDESTRVRGSPCQIHLSLSLIHNTLNSHNSYASIVYYEMLII